MAIRELLYAKSIPINDNIIIRLPTIGEIVESQEEYYSLITMLTSMPIDMMVMLDEIGIDFTTIDEYQLFLLLFPTVASRDTSLIFGDLDLTKFTLATSVDNGRPVLLDTENDIVIDEGIQMMIADTLREIHHLEKNLRKPANNEAKEFLLERAKKKAKRRRRKKEKSQLEQLIIAMVNSEQFKYDFDTVRSLTIYQFNECVQQIVHKVNYDNRMIGVYTGNISSKDLSQDDMNWLSHK